MSSVQRAVFQCDGCGVTADLIVQEAPGRYGPRDHEGRRAMPEGWARLRADTDFCKACLDTPVIVPRWPARFMAVWSPNEETTAAHVITYFGRWPE